MEKEFIEKGYAFTRTDAERRLRSYKESSEALRSSRLHLSGCIDEAVIHAQMYSTRALILSIEDLRERILLYEHYVKGTSLESCARVLGISRRTVFRLKLRALDAVAERLNAAERC